MKAKEFIKILEKHPEAEVFFNSDNMLAVITEATVMRETDETLLDCINLQRKQEGMTLVTWEDLEPGENERPYRFKTPLIRQQREDMFEYKQIFVVFPEREKKVIDYLLGI